MQLDNNCKKRFIHHISHIRIVCILLLAGLLLEGCFKNNSLPSSEPSTIKPATVKPKHIDKISPLTRESGEKIKEDILLENHPEEPFPEATDRLITHTDDITKKTIVNNVKKHSEKPKLLSERDLKTQQKFAREQRANQLKNQKELEAKIFKTTQGDYAIKFYQKEGEWRAKITGENIKSMDLVAILDEETISRLVNVNPIKNHLRVILPTVDKEGFVVYDTGFGGMKRKKTLPQDLSTSDTLASSTSSQPSNTTTTSATTTPKANTSTSDVSSSLTTGDQPSPKSPGNSPVKKKSKSVAEDNSFEDRILFIGVDWSSSSEEGSKEEHVPSQGFKKDDSQIVNGSTFLNNTNFQSNKTSQEEVEEASGELDTSGTLVISQDISQQAEETFQIAAGAQSFSLSPLTLQGDQHSKLVDNIWKSLEEAYNSWGITRKQDHKERAIENLERSLLQITRLLKALKSDDTLGENTPEGVTGETAQQSDSSEEIPAYFKLVESAERGDPVAQYSLGKKYYEVFQEQTIKGALYEAETWLTAATSQGHKEAEKLLDELKKLKESENKSHQSETEKDRSIPITSPRDLYYDDHDVNEAISLYIKFNSAYNYYKASKYLLSSNTGELSILDNQDGIKYIVAVSPAINLGGLNHALELKTGDFVTSVNIGYWLNRNTQPIQAKGELEKALEELVNFKPNPTEDPYTQLRHKIDELKLSSIEEIFNKADSTDIKNFTARFTEELDKLREANKDLLDELLPFLVESNDSHAKILIPYNLDELHWLTGEMRIHKEGQKYQVEVFAHDPMGGGKMEDETFNKLQNAIVNKIKEYDSQAQVICENKQSTYSHRRQAVGDGVSCGVIVTQELLDRITGGDISATTYSTGALELRKNHLDLFKLHGDENEQFSKRNNPKISFITNNEEKRLLELELSNPIAIDVRDEQEDIEKPLQDKTQVDEDPFNIILKYLEGEKIALDEDELKALEKLQVLPAKAGSKAKELLQRLKLKAEKAYQEAEKLLADFEKGGDVEVIKEAINKYRNASYLGHKLAQEKLIELRDSSDYRKIKLYVIKPNPTVDDRIKSLRDTYTDKNNLLPEGEHPLKLSDLIIMKLNLEKSPKSIEWGGILPDVLLSEPLFKMPDTEKYEDVIMIIDIAGKGKDETGYCVVKRYKDYYFIMAVGGLGGAYITDKQERLPARGEMLDEIAGIIKKYNVSLVRIESNIDSSYEIVLSSHLAKKFIRARVEAYNEVRRRRKGEPQQAETKKDKDLGKATRIIDSLKDLLKEHKIIISQEALLGDMNADPIDNFNYKLFHQLEVIRIPPLTQSFRHDDRLDATASAINYLNKKRLTEKKERKDIKESKDKLRIAEMYSSKKKTKTAGAKIEKSRKAFNNYSDCLLQNAQDSLSRGEKGWLSLKYLDQKEEGMRELESAASAGYDKAQYRLAKIYLREKIKETEAIKYLRLSAENYPKATYKLAMMLLDEEPKDETKLKEVLSMLNSLTGEKSEGFLKESTLGSILDELAFRYPETNYKVGCLFYKRNILGQNMSKARNYFLNYISSQSNVELTEYKKAAYKLAEIYYYAKGLEQEHLGLALDWYKKAKNLKGKEEKIKLKIQAIRNKLSKDKSKMAA